MCHMVADTTAELLAMASWVGVDARWIQKPGTPYEHFDLSQTKRAEAIAHGAREVSQRDLGMILRQKRGAKIPSDWIHPLERS